MQSVCPGLCGLRLRFPVGAPAPPCAQAPAAPRGAHGALVSVSALRAVCQSAAFGRVMAVGPPPTRTSFASLTSSAPWPVRPPEGGSLQSAGVISISSLSGPRVSCPPRPAVAAGKGLVSGASPRPQLPLRLALARFFSSLLQARRGAPGVRSSRAFPQTCPPMLRTTGLLFFCICIALVLIAIYT